MSNETGNDKNMPKFKKLAASGDFYSWNQELKLHFLTLDLWNLVETAPPQTLYADATGRMKLARCQRDLLLVLEPELKLLVGHLNSAHEMYIRIKKTFVGSPVAEKSRLLRDLARIRYTGNFFSFFTVYQSCMSQVASRGGGITDTIIMQFLHKLPNSLNNIVYIHMQQIENATDDTNFNDLWLTIYDNLVSYLISCGWFKPQQEKNETAFSATKQIKCWNCGKNGHVKKNCQEKTVENQERDQDKKPENQNWMMQSINDNVEILLDSGASQHTCGYKEKFKNMRSIEPEQILTANGIITFNTIGSIDLVLDNGLNVTLHDVAYWPSAPFLVSVSRLADKNIEVNFLKDHANISKNGTSLSVLPLCRICLKF